MPKRYYVFEKNRLTCWIRLRTCNPNGFQYFLGQVIAICLVGIKLACIEDVFTNNEELQCHFFHHFLKFGHVSSLLVNFKHLCVCVIVYPNFSSPHLDFQYPNIAITYMILFHPYEELMELQMSNGVNANRLQGPFYRWPLSWVQMSYCLAFETILIILSPIVFFQWEPEYKICFKIKGF